MREGMWTVTPPSTDGLLALYDFAPGNVVNSKSGQVFKLLLITKQISLSLCSMIFFSS